MARRITGAIALSVLIAISPVPGHAQGLLHKLKDKVKQRTEQRVDQHVDHAAQAAVDKADAAASCMVTDASCIQKAQAAGQQVKVTDASGKPVSTADSAAAMSTAAQAAPCSPRSA